MPYILSFSKHLEITDAEQYINDCCIGGDIVLDQILPILKTTYSDLQSDQEDWGWFAWFRQARIKLAVDVHTMDAQSGEFQVHLTSQRPRTFLGYKIADTPELDGLRDLIVAKLESWGVAGFEIERVDEKYMSD